MRTIVLPFALLALFAACGSSPAKTSKYPPRKEGCDVQTFPEAPNLQTDNIGVVNAMCDERVTDDECMRTLKDEACKLGGDIVWGIEGPKMDLGKKKLSGRAGHTKAPVAK